MRNIESEQRMDLVLIRLVLHFRAAMKMANMDAVLDYMFTNPKAADGVSILGHLYCEIPLFV